MAVVSDRQTFWEHLDVLRAVLLRIAVVTVVCGMVAFMLKDELFAVVLAPGKSCFITYRLLFRIGGIFDVNDTSDFSVQLINTGVAQQFIIHVKTAVCAGMLCASPYILYQLFRFISPALHVNERKYAVHIVGSGYLMFMLGVTMSYFILFPLTFHFLSTYQVSDDVKNMITLQSYMSTLIMMCLSMGLVFEMPVLAWLFARMGLLSAAFMRRYRRHAIVLILITAAVITPTSDIFTLLLVSCPMCLLYETSILLVRTVVNKKENHEA